MRKGIVQLVAIGVVIGIAVTLVAVLFQWLPTSNSEEFDRIQDIYWFATMVSPSRAKAPKTIATVSDATTTARVSFRVRCTRAPRSRSTIAGAVRHHDGQRIE